MLTIKVFIFLAAVSSLNCVYNLDVPGYISPSLFSIIPPYIRFQPISKNISIPTNIRKHLFWPTVKGKRKELHDASIEAAGLKLVASTSVNLPKTLGWIRTPSKKLQKVLSPTRFQKVSLFPGFHHVCHKDVMWRNLKLLKQKFPQVSLSFVPQTFILPEDVTEYKKAWEHTEHKLWISKLPKESRGRGIQMLKDWRDFEESEAYNGSTVVQKYVHDPYLYENLKVELQYTFILTSVHPLRIYSLPKGLRVKLGKANYSAHVEFSDQPCIHNEATEEEECERPEAYYLPGNEERGENMKEILRAIDAQFGMNKILLFMNHAITMSLIGVQHKLSRSFLKHAHSRYNYFHIMSSDFILDENGKPWMLEINSSPMRAAQNAWLATVEQNYYSEMLNIAGFHFPPSLGRRAQTILRNHLKADHSSTVVFDESIYKIQLSKEDIQKQRRFANITEREEYVHPILENLTAQEIRMLMLAEDELHRTRDLKRVFPTKSTFKYIQFIPKSDAYYYKLFDAWELKCRDSRKFCHQLLENK